MKAIIGLQAAVLSACLFGLSACGGDDPKGDSFTLAGKVVAPAAGGAEVTVAVGDKRFVVAADDSGGYQVKIRSSNPAAPVAIVAKLGSALSFVELTGKPGNFGDLLAAAGVDGTLSAGDDSSLNVSSLSTADTALADEAQDADARKAFEFGAAVDPDAALTLAAAIELLMRQPQTYELPEGVATTLALARAETARERFIAEIKRTAAPALELAKQQIVANADIVGTPDSAQQPGEMIVSILGGDEADERAPLALCYGCSHRSSGFSFNADGTGQFFSDFIGSATTWRRVGTVLQVRYTTPFATEFTELAPCDGVNQTQRVRSREAGYDLVMLSATAASATRVVRLSYPDCGTRPFRTVRSTLAGTLLSDSNTEPLTTAQFSDQRYVLPVLKPAAEPQGDFDVQFEADVVAFDAGSAASGRYVIDAAAWSVADGRLRLAYGVDTVGRYRVARDIDGQAKLLLADFTRAGQRFVTVARALAGNDFTAFASNEVPGRYFYLGVGSEVDDNPLLQGLRLRLDPGGKGAVEDDDINSAGEVVDSESSYKVRWTVDVNGELEFRRYQNSEDVAGGCDAPSENCEQLDARRFVPIAKVGERYYVLDRREFIDSDSGAVSLRVNEPMFYDRVPLDE